LFLFVIAVLSIVVFFLFLLPHEQTSLLMLWTAFSPTCASAGSIRLFSFIIIIIIITAV
jgi:hypothetical protein